MQYLSIFYHSLLKKATEFDAVSAGSEPAIMPVICGQPAPDVCHLYRSGL